MEKIAIIGTAHVAAGGLGDNAANRSEAIADRALDRLALADHLLEPHSMTVQLRVGINAGPPVDGSIGDGRFRYDPRGDPVNAAIRMETKGEPGRIQVLRAIHDRLKDRFEFEERCERDVRG